MKYIDIVTNEHTEEYQRLVDGIGSLLAESRQKVATSINTVMVETYWNIGRYIVEFEQHGNERAVYGSDLINRLSKNLTHRYGKGFGKSNLLYIRKLYVSFPKSGTLSHLLTWSHYYEVLKCDDPLEMGFYIAQCETEHWSVRELKRQMKSMLFHRLALSTDKKGVLPVDCLKARKKERSLAKPTFIDILEIFSSGLARSSCFAYSIR